MGKVSYYNQGGGRRQQIADWVNDEIQRENKGFYIREIEIDIQQNNFRLAYDKFNALVISFQDETLVYLIVNNKQQFGDQVILDLMNRVIKSQTVVTPQRVKTGKKTTFKGFKKTVVIRETRIFGIDKQGKRRQAIVSTVIRGKVVYPVLRDKKTGKFLKSTKAFKKKVGKK